MPVNDLHFAVVVGISNYPGFPALRAAQNDASAFYDWVTDPNGGGVPPEQAAKIILPQPPPLPPLRDAVPKRDLIYNALEDFKNQARDYLKPHPTDWEKTRLYFYVSGHGIAPDAGTDDAALLAADADPNNLGKHVSCATLVNFFSRVQHFKELVILADCCRTQELAVKANPPDWTEATFNRGVVRKFMAFGSRYLTKSYEEIDTRGDEARSYFTRALIAGLEGGASPPGENGPITTQQLTEFIEFHMAQSDPGSFNEALEPEFGSLGNAKGIVFGPETLTYKPPKYQFTVVVNSLPVAGLEIRDRMGGAVAAPVMPKGDGKTFFCLLPWGLYEAVPLVGDPPVPQPQAWVFEVNEGEKHRAF